MAGMEKLSSNLENRIVRYDEAVDPEQLTAHPLNFRRHPIVQRKALRASIEGHGWVAPVIATVDGIVIDGHARVEEALSGGVTVPVVFVDLDEGEAGSMILRLDPIAAMAVTDTDVLSMLLADEEWLPEEQVLADVLGGMVQDDGQGSDPIEGADDIPERVEAHSKPGDVWLLRSEHGMVHRVLCGDSRDADDVKHVMDGQQMAMIHADPPYGMGKESEGVLNDNLYGPKLDKFQMAWWNAVRPHVADNGSAYVWGNAEDLWRWWFIGGLCDSERFSLRNEIVWSKGSGQGMNEESRRMFSPSSERCLFFMFGEQEQSTNADQYWDGWEPIRAYLDGERQKMGWNAKDVKRITGTGMHSHWFTRSQWVMPTRENYDKLRESAAGEAFHREYDEIHREWMNLRSPFDNTHDSMTDVWDYPRVAGEERQGHATPKPVDMMTRILKSSSNPGDNIVEPFLGSGTTLIACELEHRTCYGIELSPAYVDIICARWQGLTGIMPEHADTGEVHDFIGNP